MRERTRRYLWESGETAARLARAVLAPLESLFAASVKVRNLAYDRAWLPSHPLALPTLCVGNLTVGGVGKTPVTAWLASRLSAMGTRPAIVLRGVGNDEVLVHRHLNPGIFVLTDADRVRGVERARDMGATLTLLDDGFQHRRARRDVDLALISADRFGPVSMLPIGPWREPLTALARAHGIVVIRKSAALAVAREVLAHALTYAPQAVGAVLALIPDALVNAFTGENRPLSALVGVPVLAISAIGDPDSFEAQLRALGARVTSETRADHHDFGAEEIGILSKRVTGGMTVVCTLKDAVKLAPAWPREASTLWYLSQRVQAETGADELAGLVASFAARTAPRGNTTLAPAGPTI